MSETLQEEALRLRNIIYLDSHGPVSKEKWAAMEELWVQDIDWLRKKANEPLKLFGEVIINKDTVTENPPEISKDIPKDKKNSIVEKVC